MIDRDRCAHPHTALARISGRVMCWRCGALTDLPSPDAQTVTFSDNDGPLVNIAAFGARGNGEHDDAPSIQAAVDSLGGGASWQVEAARRVEELGWDLIVTCLHALGLTERGEDG